MNPVYDKKRWDWARSKCFSRPMEEEVESIVVRHWHSTEECTETLGAQVSSACPLWSFTLGRVQPLGQSRRVAMDP